MFSKIMYAIRTLRFKLLTSYILLSVVPLFVLWIIITVQFENHMRERQLSDLRAWTSMIATDLSNTAFFDDADFREERSADLARNSESFSSRIIITNTMGVVVHDTAQPYSDLIGTTLASSVIMLSLDGYASYNIETEPELTIQTAATITNDGEIVGAVMLSHTMVDADGIIVGITSQVLLLIAILGAAISMLVFLVASWLLNPLKSVSAAVTKVSEGHLDQNVQIEGRGEIYDLSVAFNDMSQKLGRTEAARQEFVSHVSHELKTPLSAMKVLSESLLHLENADKETYDDFLSDINSEVDRMSAIIDELLTLVKLDETELPLNITTIDLNKLLMDIIKRLSPLSGQRGINVELAQDNQVSIEGDHMKLTLAISNVIENAIKYSFDEGHVKVLIRADAKHAFITVSDSGVGIDEDDQSKIFARFYRADKGRDRQTGGTGLGLSITHKTLLLHSGTIKVTSALGEGSTFEVKIPKNN